MGITDSLLQSAAKQKRKSEYLLYKECYAPLMSVAYRYFKNEEDRMVALNESFYKVLKGLKEFLEHNPSSQFIFWAKRITTNTCIDLIRKQKRSLEIPSEDMPVEAHVADLNSTEVDVEELEKLLGRLPEVQQLVMNMHAIDGYSHKEISAQLGITEENSRYHLSAARRSLTNWLNAAKENLKSFVL
jgi:RNA polymerase sigma factor (sigma-70 family)